MTTPDDAKKEAALAFLKFQDLGVLATSNADNTPSARAIYYAADDDFNVFFVTLKNTRKVADLMKSGRAAFTVYDRNKPATLQMEGIVADRTDSAVIDPIVIKLLERISAKGDHFAPLTHLDPAVVRFFKLTPTWVRYGDFSSGTGNEEVYTEIHPSSS